MTKLAATQLSLIAESDFVDSPVGDWAYDELGTNNFLVPNSDNSELGTNNFLVPNSRTVSTGSCRVLSQILHKNEVTYSQLLVPNLESWKPPIGCFQQKPIKGHLYWYWRYYDNRGKKASKYLAKDYNKAVRKAIEIGIPPNAKSNQTDLLQTDPQTATASQSNIIDIASTAYSAPRAA